MVPSVLLRAETNCLTTRSISTTTLVAVLPLVRWRAAAAQRPFNGVTYGSAAIAHPTPAISQFAPAVPLRDLQNGSQFFVLLLEIVHYLTGYIGNKN